jgi:hypothetical protein
MAGFHDSTPRARGGSVALATANREGGPAMPSSGSQPGNAMERLLKRLRERRERRAERARDKAELRRDRERRGDVGKGGTGDHGGFTSGF